jgi:hypothetical protein
VANRSTCHLVLLWVLSMSSTFTDLNMAKSVSIASVGTASIVATEDAHDDIVTGGHTPVTITPELMVLRPDIALRDWNPSALIPFDDFLAHDIDGIPALTP